MSVPTFVQIGPLVQSLKVTQNINAHKHTQNYSLIKLFSFLLEWKVDLKRG
jgi:hypothetical protein